MKGSIRTRQHCPVCEGPFKVIPRAGLICPEHKTIPTHFFIDIYFRGRIRITHNKIGQSLKTYGDALSLLGKINEEIKARTFDRSDYVKKDQAKFLVEKLLDKFWESKKKEIAPGYQGHYLGFIAREKVFFTGRDIRDLRRMDLVDFVDSLRTGGKTLKNYLDHFRVFLRWAKTDMEMIAIVPTFPKLKVPASPFRWLSRDDQINLYELVPEVDKPFFAFLMLSGCRPGEARALRVEDADWINKTVSIHSTFSGVAYRPRRKGRGAKPCLIALHRELWPYAESRLKEAISGAWLFPNPRTGENYSVQAIRKIWEKVRTAAGVSKDLRLYDATRHSFCSQLRSAGVSLEDIRDHVGHSSITTTLRYAHGTLDSLRANLEKLSLKKVVPIQEGVSQTGHSEGFIQKESK